MGKHHGHKVQVLRSITGEYSVIGKAKTIYDLGIKIKSKNRLNASIKVQQETQNRAGRRIRAQCTRNNKEKGPAWLRSKPRPWSKWQKPQSKVFMKTAFQTWLATT